MQEELKEEEYEVAPKVKALSIVNKDYRRAKKHLLSWHRSCNERYKHYRAAGLEQNILQDNQFPVPFTAEQVDQLRADMMEKLWYKDKPCSLYGRNKADKEDANVKSDFMKYQDKEDDIYVKSDQGVMHCALYGIAPAVVNFKEEHETRREVEEQPIEIAPGVYGTDLDGNIQMVPVEVEKQIPTYQGSSVELIDPIDFFFTPEKRDIYDEYPVMVRSHRSKEWLKSKSYIDDSALSQLDDEGGVDITNEDLLTERRELVGYGDSDKRQEEYEYVEWHGYANLDGKDGERKLWIIGVVDGGAVVRIDDANEIFRLGHPNIIVGVIDKEFGEMRGQSLLDKIHSTQHAMDSMMSMLLKNMRQGVNFMWIGNSSRMKTKKLVNDAGTFIDVEGDNIDNVLKRIEPKSISRDIYDGISLFREMGQNSSGIKDISTGIAQEGVETLGEANILASQGGLRMKRYLKMFETTFIQPLWEMRNQINQTFVTDVGYLYSIVEEDIIYWRTIDPSQMRTNVDFICEASTRENLRAVRIQQVMQALNIVTGLTMAVGPMPALKLLEKLYKDGFDWPEDEIKELLPFEPIAGQIIQNQQDQQVAQMSQMNQMAAKAQSPGSMSQPKTEGDAQKSAQAKGQPQVGRVQ